MVKLPRPRPYYSVRTSADPKAGRLDIDTCRDFFKLVFDRLRSEGYFDEVFGSYCVDAGRVFGTAGPDIETFVYLHTRKRLWPIEDLFFLWSEEDLFDAIEFLFDQVSQPADGWEHTYNDCGMHWHSFDKAEGQKVYREGMNSLLEMYGPGYELNPRGEIMSLGDRGMGKLLKASLPTTDPDIRARLSSAIELFQRYRSSIGDRRHAVRDLADVLEKMRPQLKEVLDNKDENALFEIANNFAIRHANDKQKGNYDPAVWLSWMFYFYLATINAALHLLARKEKRASTP